MSFSISLFHSFFLFSIFQKALWTNLISFNFLLISSVYLLFLCRKKHLRTNTYSYTHVHTLISISTRSIHKMTFFSAEFNPLLFSLYHYFYYYYYFCFFFGEILRLNFIFTRFNFFRWNHIYIREICKNKMPKIKKNYKSTLLFDFSFFYWCLNLWEENEVYEFIIAIWRSKKPYRNKV